MFKKLLTEFIGTFFLILTVGCSVFAGVRGIIPPIAIGFILMVMVYAGGYISGGHYNPAVSLSAAIRGALNWKDLVPYWAVQILGGILAALLVRYLVVIPPIENAPEFNFVVVSVAEILFTFALCYVVLHTATRKESNSYYGFAIGATVTAGAFATAGLCLGAFNPAVAIGLLTMGFIGWKVIGITVLANLIGGTLAGYVFKLTSTEE